jgi:iron complex transport system substrate-binding protein
MRRTVLGLAAALAAAVGWAPGPAGAAPASRIVALAPHLAEIVWAAGAGDRLVGAVQWSDYPPAVADLPRVGDAFNIDDERIAALEPDLVVAWAGGTPTAVIERLRGRGYRVEVLGTSALGEVADQILAIGEWAGTGEAAGAAAEAYLGRLDALRGTQSGKAPVRVFYQVSSRPLYTVGGEQVITQVISLCRGENVFADLGQLAAVVDLESVIARNPEAILATSGASLESWDRWPELAAVRYGNVFTVAGDLIARPSPRLLQGAEQVCGRLDEARAHLNAR